MYCIKNSLLQLCIETDPFWVTCWALDLLTLSSRVSPTFSFCCHLSPSVCLSLSLPLSPPSVSLSLFFPRLCLTIFSLSPLLNLSFDQSLFAFDLLSLFLHLYPSLSISVSLSFTFPSLLSYVSLPLSFSCDLSPHLYLSLSHFLRLSIPRLSFFTPYLSLSPTAHILSLNLYLSLVSLSLSLSFCLSISPELNSIYPSASQRENVCVRGTGGTELLFQLI